MHTIIMCILTDTIMLTILFLLASETYQFMHKEWRKTERHVKVLSGDPAGIPPTHLLWGERS